MTKIGPTLPRSRSRRQSSMYTPAPEKKALVIGINYTGADQNSEYFPLHRAQHDATEFTKLLISHYHYKKDKIVLMLDHESVPSHLQPTRENILREIGALVHDAKDGSRFTFFYSGHSGQVETLDRINEEDGLDEFLVPVDHAAICKNQNIPMDENGRAMGRSGVKKCMIIDNKLRRLLVDTLPIGSHLTAVFDSCHSATLLDLDHHLCNNVYNPRLTPSHRGYTSMWQNARKRSQADDRIITKKQKLSDLKGKERTSSGDIRTYQRTRVSEVTNTLGKRKFSVESKRKSVRVQRSLSVTEATKDDALIDSRADDADGVLPGERCSSPSPLTCNGLTCNGFCEFDEHPGRRATVLSISSCQDAQTTYESRKGSFTKFLVGILRRDPNISIQNFLQKVSDEMYDQAQRGRIWHQKCMDSLKQAVADAQRLTKEQLDRYNFDDVPRPQVGSMARVNLALSLNL